MAQSADEHSVIAKPLRSFVMAHYDVGPLSTWTLLKGGTNDTYRVGTAQGQYVLRLYGRAWRSPTDIAYEIDLLRHLERKGVPVASPIARADGGFLSPVALPEGERYAVLFADVPGTPPPWPPDPAYYRPYGQAAAAVHKALDDFSSPHARAPLDLTHLIERPLRALLRVVAPDWQGVNDLHRIAAYVSARVGTVAATLAWGPCHGDFNGANCHAHSDGPVTFFDCDCCGPGWRVYDLAVLRWAAALNHAEAIWPAFLAGYQEGRRLTEVECAALPYFVAIRHLWWFDTHASAEAERQGQAYFERGVRFLRDWERAQLAN